MEPGETHEAKCPNNPEGKTDREPVIIKLPDGSHFRSDIITGVKVGEASEDGHPITGSRVIIYLIHEGARVCYVKDDDQARAVAGRIVELTGRPVEDLSNLTLTPTNDES